MSHLFRLCGLFCHLLPERNCYLKIMVFITLFCSTYITVLYCYCNFLMCKKEHSMNIHLEITFKRLICAYQYRPYAQKFQKKVLLNFLRTLVVRIYRIESQ